jgi:hypothetical protein
MPSSELTEALSELGQALGLRPRETEPAAAFARRCTAAARQLRRGAGVTWADYELLRVEKNRAWFALRKPPEHSPLGGPRWPMDTGQGLDELAGKLGTYEDQSG